MATKFCPIPKYCNVWCEWIIHISQWNDTGPSWPSCFSEHDRNKSMAPPPLPLSLTKDDFVTEKGSRSTASSKGNSNSFLLLITAS